VIKRDNCDKPATVSNKTVPWGLCFGTLQRRRVIIWHPAGSSYRCRKTTATPMMSGSGSRTRQGSRPVLIVKSGCQWNLWKLIVSPRQTSIYVMCPSDHDGCCFARSQRCVCCFLVSSKVFFPAISLLYLLNIFYRLSSLLFYFVHIQRMLMLLYYRLLRMSVFRLNKRGLNC
jgi:hypothetical protein